MHLDIGSPESNNGTTVLVLRIGVSELEGIIITKRLKAKIDALKPLEEGGKPSDYMHVYLHVARAIEKQRGIQKPPPKKPMISLN